MTAIANWTKTATYHATIDAAGRRIEYMRMGEVIRLASVHDPASAAPARRLLAPDWTASGAIDADEMIGSGRGLTVYGRHWRERPTLDEARCLDPGAVAAVGRAEKKLARVKIEPAP